MPSKLLIAAAEAAHAIDHAPHFGVRPEGYDVDGEAVMQRVQRERDRFAGFVVKAVEGIDPEQRLRGWARFVGPTSLIVGDETQGDHTRVEAKSVVIAAGTDPWIPPGFDQLGDRLLTNDEVFELPTLPKSIAVVGTGVIGLELGQAFSRLGVRTSLFNRSLNVGPLQDPRLQSLSREIFGEELDLRLGAQGLKGTLEDGGVRLDWTDTRGKAHSAHFDYVLAAAGRRPNFARLGLDEEAMKGFGIPLDARKMPKLDHRTMQLGELPIFVAGDVVGERSLLHEAADEGRIAGENAANYPDVRAKVRRTQLAITFSDPNIASAGADVRSLDPETHAFGEVDYSDQGRARVMGKNQGAVRIWASKECGTLRAAEMIGPRVEHTAHLLAWAIDQNLNVDQALAMPFYHPVIEEGIRTALRNLSRAVLHGGGTVDCTPAA